MTAATPSTHANVTVDGFSLERWQFGLLQCLPDWAGRVEIAASVFVVGTCVDESISL